MRARWLAGPLSALMIFTTLTAVASMRATITVMLSTTTTLSAV